VSEKISRKVLVKSDDAFLSSAHRAAVMYTSHRKWIGIVAGLVLLLGVGAFGARAYLDQHRAESSALFAEGLDILDKPVSTEVPAEGAEKPFASDAEKWKAAKAKFEAAVDRAGSAKVGVLARFYVADLAEKQGDKKVAEEQFQKIVERLDADSSVFFVAVERLAFLQEARGDKISAAKTYARLVQAKKSFYRDRAALSEARLYQETGDTEKARQVLQAAVKDLPSSPLQDPLRQRLTLLGGSPLPIKTDNISADASKKP
jgi:tetratricopeptide (TPR) repeat protein